MYELDENPQNDPPYTNLPRAGESRLLQGYIPSEPLVSTLEISSSAKGTVYERAMAAEVRHQLGDESGNAISNVNFGYYDTSPAMNAVSRFRGLRPPIDTVVKLSGERPINANHITINNKHQGIATQAPTINTVDDLWAMVKEQNVGVIVDLTNATDKMNRKIPEYRPNGQSGWSPDGSKARADDAGIYRDPNAQFTVSVEQPMYSNIDAAGAVGGALAAVGDADYANIETIETKDYQVTTNDGQESKLRSINLVTWPDHGAIELAQLKGLIDQIRDARSEISGDLLIHCSAGVGRTGTIFAGLALQEMHDNGELTAENYATKAMQVITEGRMSRGQAFVQTGAQLQLVLEYAKSLVTADG